MNTDATPSDDSVQRRFGASAENYVTSSIHSGGYTLDKLIELVAPVQDQRVLDVATGGGHVALALAQRGAAVIASDLTVKMLEVARRHISKQGSSLTYCCNNAEALPFPEGSFDRVTTRLAPHHFQDAPRYMSECARVLRSGGLLGVVDHAGAIDFQVAKYVNAFEKLRDPSHAWEFNEIEWKALFHEAGLRVTHSEVVRQRVLFNWWTKMQNCDAETVMRLRVMLRQMPRTVAAWMEPETPQLGEWYFTRWQIIIAGVKA
jgi:ubiquinone/menaquinone biosynthesis C-methylase UbiE